MPEQDIVERLLADVMQLLQASKNAEFCDGVAVRVRDIGGLLEDLQGSIDEIERLRAERGRYRKALGQVVRDLVAAIDTDPK